MASASIPMSTSLIPVGLDAVIVWVVPEELFISTLDLLKGKGVDNLEVYPQRGIICLNRLDTGLGKYAFKKWEPFILFVTC